MIASALDEIKLYGLKNGSERLRIQAVDVAGNSSEQEVVVSLKKETEWQTIHRLIKQMIQWFSQIL